MNPTAVKKYPIYVIIAAAIAVNLGFSHTVIVPQDAELSALGARLYALREGAAGRDASIGDTAADAAAGVMEFKEKLPAAGKLTRVITEVFSVARRNGLNIPAGDYSSETTKESDISRYTISLPVEGRYPQIKRFIYEMENMRYMVAIEDITMTSGKASEGVIALKFRMSVYYR